MPARFGARRQAAFTGGSLEAQVRALLPTAWYAPSDVPTLKQNSNGTTAVSASGDPVGYMSDRIAGLINATQATAGKRPLWRPAYLENQASGGMVAGANGDFAAQSFTVFVVYKKTADVNFQAILNKGNGTSAAGSSWEVMASTSGNFKVSFDTFLGGANNSDCKYSASNEWELITAVRNGNASKSLYMNGVLRATGGDSGTAMNAGQFPLGVGNAGGTGNLYLAGNIRDVLYFPAALNDTDRATVERYLLAKNSIPPRPTLMLSTFDKAEIPRKSLYILQTTNERDFSYPSGISGAVLVFPSNGGTGTTAGTSASSIMYYAAKYWLAYELNNFSGAQHSFGIQTADALAGPWTWLTDVTVNLANGYTWNPRWVVDDDGSIHIIVGAGSTPDSIQQYFLDALNAGLTSWSAPTALTGTSLPTDMIDPWIIMPSQSPNGKYILWYKNDTTKYVEYMTSTSLKSGYAVTKSGDWAGFGTFVEGPIVVRTSPTTWTLYGDQQSSNGYAAAVSLDDWATWSTLRTITTTGFASGVGTGSILVAP